MHRASKYRHRCTGVPAIFLTTITGFFSQKLPVIFGNSEILEFQDLTEK
jgi:hypothetical protein